MCHAPFIGGKLGLAHPTDIHKGEKTLHEANTGADLWAGPAFDPPPLSTITERPSPPRAREVKNCVSEKPACPHPVPSRLAPKIDRPPSLPIRAGPVTVRVPYGPSVFL